MSAGQKGYRARVVDAELGNRLRRSGAVLVEGPKGCGKTETSRQLAASELQVDIDPRVPGYMEVDPSLMLAGDAPRLLDEWQAQPALWDLVRHAVDERQVKGQYILTGSSHPVEEARLHSGAGRISRMRMRPMSSVESGFSTGEVSLESLLSSEGPEPVDKSPDLDGVIGAIVRGGWPTAQDVSLDDARAQMRDYVDLLAEADAKALGPRRRDPARVALLLQSLARSVATEASISTIATDVGPERGSLARETVVDYLDALTRLMVVEDLPAWPQHLRSSAALRKAPKRHFVDPALAVAALGVGPDSLTRDLNFTGQLFESFVVRDLRVYSQQLDARVFHARDSYGNEADAIVQRRDGPWVAVEIKLGPGAVETAATSLKKFADSVDVDRAGRCAGLVVITGWGLAYRRRDGVDVVPFTALGP